jgi:hypothetical protein
MFAKTLDGSTIIPEMLGRVKKDFEIAGRIYSSYPKKSGVD